MINNLLYYLECWQIVQNPVEGADHLFRNEWELVWLAALIDPEGGSLMTKNEFNVRIQSIMKFLESKLRSVKARYFDPLEVTEYFERFAKIRADLKEQFRDKFDDLRERDLPTSSKTSDYEGRGYIVRLPLEQLYEDCRFAIELLEVLDQPTAPRIQDDSDLGLTLEEESKEIFISHASKDRTLVQLFVERVLRIGMDITSNRIFCTSLDGMNLQNGQDFREQIRLALLKARIVIFIVTPNYKASEVCQNEMGAAWYSDKVVIPLIVDPIDFDSVGVLMEPRQIPKISDSKALSKVRDDIVRHLGLNATKTDMWDAGKESFLVDLESTLQKIQFPVAKKPEEVAKIEAESKSLREQIGAVGAKLAQLQSKYDEVVKAKDTTTLKAIEEKYDDRTQLEKFNEITKSVWKCLNPLPNVVQAMILCEYFRQPYSPPVSEYTKELQAAERRKQISFDGEQFRINEDNKDAKAVITSLRKLEQFIEQSNENFPDQYESEYKSSLEVNNEEFWEEHFAVKIPT